MPSRRRFITTAVAAGAAVAAGPAVRLSEAQQAPVTPAAGHGSNDLVLVNGRIHTMDARATVVRSVTIRIRPHRRHRQHAAAGCHGPPDRPARPHGGARPDRAARAHRQPGEPPRLPHHPREHGLDSREVQQTLAARRKSVPDGQWITSMGGWHPNQWAEHRHPTLKELDEAVPDRPVLLYERFTGPAVTNSLGKKLFDALDAGGAGAPGHQEGGGLRHGRHCRRRALPAAARRRARSSTCAGCRRIADKRRSTLDAMNYSTALGLTAHLDQVLFPTPGPLHPNQILSNLDHYRMYDSWIRAAPRGSRHGAPADELPAQPGRPGAARAEGAAAQLVPVLRRRHAARPARSASGPPRSGRGRCGATRSAWWRRPAGATRTACRTWPGCSRWWRTGRR